MPLSVLIGMFIRLGCVDASLPVITLNGLSRVCILLSVPMYSGYALRYVLINFANSLYSMMCPTTSCVFSIFSSSALDVEYPVLVRAVVGKPNLLNSRLLSCSGLLTFNGFPLNICILLSSNSARPSNSYSSGANFSMLRYMPL